MKKENNKQLLKRLCREYGVHQEHLYNKTGLYFMDIVKLNLTEKDICYLLEKGALKNGKI